MENNQEEKRKLSAGFKYVGIGFQMIAIIGLLTFIGYKIDAHYQHKSKLITAGFALVGVGIALYQVIRQVNQK